MHRNNLLVATLTLTATPPPSPTAYTLLLHHLKVHPLWCCDIQPISSMARNLRNKCVVGREARVALGWGFGGVGKRVLEGRGWIAGWLVGERGEFRV